MSERGIMPTFTPFQRQCLDQAVIRLRFTSGEQQAMQRQLQQAPLQERELLLCALSPEYCINSYIKIYDAQAQTWIPFHLWKEQGDALNLFHTRQMVIALKARQLGLTWLVLALGLWHMLFRPISTGLVFSRRDDESMYLLSEERLKGMYARLPDWMKARKVEVSSGHQFKLSNGSMVYAFPTTGGDSYTASWVIVDEADLIPDFNRFMRSVKPTIDAGGKLWLVTRSNKSAPNSEVKRIYRAAKAGANGWAHIFLPWWVRPARDATWYEAQKADIQMRTGGLDDLYEQYPATDAEALAPASLHKRLPREWVEPGYVEQAPIPEKQLPPDAPRIPGLVVYRPPEQFKKYVGGLDCAEGLPTSDDSAATFIHCETGEEVCNLVGKFTPAIQAAYCAQISTWYNNAGLMVERNNHGHATIGWLMDNGHEGRVLNGDDGRSGWMSSTLGKVLLYDAGAEAFREKETMLHDFETLTQLLSIEKGTLRAPEGEMDDRADSFVLALVGRQEIARSGQGIGFMQGRVKW